MKATVESSGIAATVEIRDYADDERYVEIFVTIDPAPPGLDRLAYTRVQKIPE
jgi:hypothetical protein